MVSKGEELKTTSTVEKLCREISVTPYAKRCVKSRSQHFENIVSCFKRFFLFEHNNRVFRVKMKQGTQSLNALTRLAFSANEVAQILGVSRATVYRMIALGEIRPISHNGTLRFSQKEIDRYVGTTMEVAA
jgi:excisionase family DNA binding protein